MLLVMNIDPATQAQALASVLALASANGVKFELRDTATAPVTAPAPQPKAERKPLDAPKDVVLGITVKPCGRGKLGFTLGYGAGRAGAKAMVKSAGFAWDGELGAYVGTTAQAKTLGLTSKSTELAVSAQWVQVGRDKAQAKAERKAQRG